MGCGGPHKRQPKERDESSPGIIRPSAPHGAGPWRRLGANEIVSLVGCGGISDVCIAAVSSSKNDLKVGGQHDGHCRFNTSVR